MNFLKRMFNIGLCATIQNLRSNNIQIGGFNKVVIALRVQEWMGKYYFKAFSNRGDHVFREEVFLWESKKFKTVEEAVGHLAKEVRIAQGNFPKIIFLKITEMKDYEVTSFDEFFDGKWVKSKYEWDWDPILTMRDKFNK